MTMTVTRLCFFAVAVAAIATAINGHPCHVPDLTGVFQVTYSTLMGVAEQAGGLFGSPNFETGLVSIVEAGVGGPGTLLLYRDYRDDMGNKSAYLNSLCVQPPSSPYDRECVNIGVGLGSGFATVTATKLDDNCTTIEDAGYFRVPAFDSNNRDVITGLFSNKRIGDVPTETQ